jgi:hypothetical protein
MEVSVSDCESQVSFSSRDKGKEKVKKNYERIFKEIVGDESPTILANFKLISTGLSVIVHLL